MKVVSDFLALILFFGAYYWTRDIYIATCVAVVVGVVQAAYIWFKSKKLETMQWVSLLLIIVFGGLTIILKNEIFIKWKPSLLFWATSLAILIGALLKKNVLKKLLGKEIALPDDVWNKLSFMWVVFFVILGIINIIVAYQFTTDIWVNYKTFGSMGLMLCFFVAQGIYISKYLPKEEA